MTSKLKCPFCGEELDWCLSCPLPTMSCPNHNCNAYDFLMPKNCWCELIQTKEELKDCQHNYQVKSEQHERGYAYATKTIKDLESKLEIARKALKELIAYYDHYDSFDGEISWDGVALIMRNDAHEALGQIKHKE